MRSVLLILYFTWASISAISAPRPHPKTIKGEVVAYSTSPVCLNGNVYWSMVIRVQRPNAVLSQFIRMDFTLLCGKSPEWVSTKPSIQKLRLLRQKGSDAPLEEVIADGPKQNLALPVWKYPPGT
jgi:hypothetical protein